MTDRLISREAVDEVLVELHDEAGRKMMADRHEAMWDAISAVRALPEPTVECPGRQDDPERQGREVKPTEMKYSTQVEMERDELQGRIDRAVEWATKRGDLFPPASMLSFQRKAFIEGVYAARHVALDILSPTEEEKKH